MKSISAIIADDETLSREVIRAYLQAFPQIQLIGECADGKETIAMTNARQPDILFLDIQMPETNGLEVVRLLQAPMPLLLFVTAYDQYALPAFELNAIDYLLKPFDQERFDKAMQRTLLQLELQQAADFQQRMHTLLEDYQYLKQHYSVSELRRTAPTSEHIAIKDRHQILFLPLSDIDYIQADGDYVTIHTNEKKYLHYDTMKAMEQRLHAAHFLRIHRSVIVNTLKIKALQPHFNGEYFLTLQNGQQLKSSRSYKDNMQAFLNSRLKE